MDLVCGMDMLGWGEAIDKIKTSVSAGKQLTQSAVISSLNADSRTKYELQQKYGVDPIVAIKWAYERGLSVDRNNLAPTMQAFKSFTDSMKQRDAQIGRSASQGMASREEQFKKGFKYGK